MEINEKKHKKEQQELIIRKYQQYLKLEKSLSLNTLELSDIVRDLRIGRMPVRSSTFCGRIT